MSSEKQNSCLPGGLLILGALIALFGYAGNNNGALIFGILLAVFGGIAFFSPKPNHFVKTLDESKPTEPDVATLKGNQEFALEVVGESHYQEALEQICGPRTRNSVEQLHTALLILEDENPFDKNAVRVEIKEKTVGYLSRKVAIIYRQQLKAGGMPKANGECQAVIKGGWQKSNGEIGSYGVWLDIPVEE